MSHGHQLFICIGANHRTADITLRETLYVAPEELAMQLPKIRESLGLAECMLLSTCNRLELIALLKDDGDAPTPPHLQDAFAQLHRILHPKAAVSDEQFTHHTYAHTGLAAVRHVFAVASSLDSLVVGETQITGQFKDAFRIAEEAQTVGPMLSRLYQDALGTAKAIRTDTGIGQGTVSISSAAVELTKLVFANPGKHPILIIGAGEMARLAAERLLQYGPQMLWIASRSYDRAVDLVKTLGHGQPATLGELDELLVKAEIVISATSAPGLVISSAQLQRARRSARRRPICMVDIALPRDIDPLCAQLNDVYLFDIDDLQQIVHSNLAERQQATEMAQAILDARTQSFGHWLSTQVIKPVMAWFRSEIAALVQREERRTLERELFRELTAAQRDALTAMFSAIIDRMAGTAGRNLQHPPAGFYREQLAESLRVLFSQDPSK